MFKLARLFYKQPKSIFPSKETRALIQEGAAALDKNDFESALKRYSQIPEEEKQNKCVIGFFSSIDSKRRRQKLTEEVMATNNLKRPT